MPRPSTRRRPAFAKDLAAQRAAGQHPPAVDVVVGFDWDARKGIPRVAIRPPEHRLVPDRFEWRPDTIDWAVLAGVRVTVLARIPYRTGDAFTPWAVYAIAAEVAHMAADVTVLPADGCLEWLPAVAHVYRLQHPRYRWPSWWSDEREARAKRNRDRWHAEVFAYYCEEPEPAF